jgi:hypothetical protein
MFVTLRIARAETRLTVYRSLYSAPKILKQEADGNHVYFSDLLIVEE